MATKRTAPKDLDSSLPQAKQARLQTQPLAPTRPTSLTSVQGQKFVFPGVSSPQQTGPPISNVGPSPHPQQVGGVATSLVDLTTGISPSVARRPLNSGAVSLSGHSVIATHGTRPLHSVPASYATRVTLPGVSTVPVIHPGVGVTGLRGNATQLLASPASPHTPVPPPPPPYSVPMATPPPPPESEAEASCLSPSQFLYHPTALQTPPSLPPNTVSTPVVMSTRVTTSDKENTVNRHPECVADASRDGAMVSIKTKRAKVLKSRKGNLASMKLKYEVLLKEKFFLEGGGNLMEFVTWKRKPNILRDQYLTQHGLDSGEGDNNGHLLSPKGISQTTSNVPGRIATEEVLKDSTAIVKQRTPKEQKTFKTPQSMTAVPTSTSSTTIQIPLSTVSPGLHTGSPKQQTLLSPSKSGLAFQTPSPRPATRTQTSFSSVYESSHEDIVMRARHEADVKKAIAELRKEGLWSACRLPKVVEPARKKTQWDYLLEEMQWLATDFVNEKRWKINAAKKLSRSVARYHQEKEMQHTRMEKEDLLRLKKIASTIAKEIKHFWDSIQKVVEHKQQVLLEEKRKRAMDLHLDFIVDQTAKYSNWLVKGLATGGSRQTSIEPSLQSVASSSLDDSDDFVAPVEESDNEETIDREEEALRQEGGADDYSTELQQLQDEAEMPLEQLLDTLPPEILGTPPELPSTEVKVDIEGTLTPAESEGEEEAMEVERVKGGVASETIKEECPPIDQGAGKIILEDPRLKGRRKSPRKQDLLRPDTLKSDSIPIPTSDSAVKGEAGDSVKGEDSDSVRSGAVKGEDSDCIKGAAVKGDGVSGGAVKGEDGDSIRGAAVKGDGVSGGAVKGEDGDSIRGAAVKGDSVSGAAVKGDGVSGAAVKGDGVSGGAVKGEDGADEEYRVSGGEEEDEETTISEQEDHEGDTDYRTEMDDLQKESDLPLEDLLAMYNLHRQSGTPESEVEGDSLQGGSPMETSAPVSVSVSGDEESGESADEDGIELLVSGKSLEEACQTEAGLSDVAAVAEQFQPKGITLATTEVKTPVPFLLKHTLREYQHIGLDWLVAMHDRRLNGILADEMGLGKTIQTIALLAHLACEKGNWGPHLIIVPTSVMLNWELELKKWCPAFKILTYFGSLKERKQKRVGWSKRNAFHVCITSYNIAVTDHRAFKQKRWKYLILDEAQHIKNFKSQRWQTLLSFNSQCRLLLTGTPLQNSLMELWSLMHFLMPAVFSSHSDFKEWFSNPLTGMVEGSQEYNASIIKRLHQVLRPFLLHRIKMEVEKQMPKKYEHLVPCELSKRQRFLYDDYMSRAKTKDSLASGNYLSVINILMQLRKVCNHPDLFEPRPIISPFRMLAVEFYTASLILQGMETTPFQVVSFDFLNFKMADYEVEMDAFVAYRSRQLQAPRLLILDPTHSQVVSDSEGCESGDDVLEGEPLRTDYLEDLHLPQLSTRYEEFTMSRRRQMHEVNNRRCRRTPVYGRDLVRAVRSMCHPSESLTPKKPSTRSPLLNWSWSGHSACLRHQTSTLSWTDKSPALVAALPTVEERLERLQEIIKRFVITIPRVTAPSITLHTYHNPPSHLHNEQFINETLTKGLTHAVSVLHTTSTGMCFQFPETRLIQYDCGKLQTLDLLLQRLKAGNHRVLIFTQMGRVLDVLEIFLNYHGHTYLRLDGSTSVVKRQFLMERFNRDERVFCFILSTRSGGLGVNLTGADTVIFYDSDWNPTMDAQAQDRCHRIGQTRDVHIYRLICTSTVEENILKKANQKKMLGDIAIEGGGFTTDFFKQASLKELFKTSAETSEVKVHKAPTAEGRTASPTTQGQSSNISQKQVEDLLLQAEDEGDAKAANEARAEQVAEMAEFDEAYSTQNEGTNTEGRKVAEGDKVNPEFAAIDDQLNGVERYAMRYLEEENAGAAAEQLRLAEESIEQAKKEWELSHLQSLRQEEERLADEEVADDVNLTYDRPDNSNKVYIDEVTGEEMPTWLPPTPPADDGNDHYVDLVLDMSYDTQSNISPAILAAIASFSEEDYDVFGLSRRNTQSETIKKSQKSSNKQSKDHMNVPPSLFWRRLAADTLSTKLKKLASHQKKLKSKDQFTPLLEQHPEGPNWMYYEDWLLLKSVTVVLEFPLSLTINVPAQTPNWSVVADLTSSLSRIRRSPLQCREHLMNAVIPREDHTLKTDEQESTKKVKSRDGSSKKSKGRKEQRTKSLVLSDNGKEQSKIYSTCFDWVLQSSTKRKESPRFTWESAQKPSMHNDLLKEYGIQVDVIHSPMQVAQQRADRIQVEHPRHSQVHQLLAAQPYQLSAMVARGYHPGVGGIHFKNAAELAKAGYNLPRQAAIASAATVAGVAQKFPTITTSMSPLKLPSVTSTATPSSLSIPSASQIHTISTSGVTPVTSLMTTAVGKTTYNVPVTELGKTLIARSGLSHQQLLLLRQTTIQHQQQQAQAAASLVSPTVTQIPQTQTTKTAQQVALQQKIGPAGIEQLRASVGSVTVPLQQRAANALRGLSGTGRTLQTEEVLALLKQQSLRMAASQQYKAGSVAAQFQHRDITGATAVAHLQLRQDGVAKTTTKQQMPATVLQAESAKLIASTSPSVTASEGSQVKVEMVEQTRLPTQKPQTVKVVPAAVSQSKPSTTATVASMQVTSAQLQQVLAIQQAQQAAAAAAAAKAAKTQTASSTPGTSTPLPETSK